MLEPRAELPRPFQGVGSAGRLGPSRPGDLRRVASAPRGPSACVSRGSGGALRSFLSPRVPARPASRGPVTARPGGPLRAWDAARAASAAGRGRSCCTGRMGPARPPRAPRLPLPPRLLPALAPVTSLHDPLVYDLKAVQSIFF